jgi:large subunit ribosomal protein L22
MGARKRTSAEARKKKMQSTYIARITNHPSSPRKMRLVADLVRGQEVNKALDVLQFTRKDAAKHLEKLVRSAISNFEQKTGERAEDSSLFIREISVDGAKALKRIRPAPQGRAHRIRKRSNHVTLILDTKDEALKTRLIGKIEEAVETTEATSE